MNKASKSTGPIAALAIVGIATVYSATSSAGVLDDELSMRGEFEIGNGQSQVIAEHKSPEPYRVCVTKGRDAVPAVPVKARYDGQERTINVGDCSDLTAKVITLSPAGKLAEDEVLIGKYEHLKK